MKKPFFILLLGLIFSVSISAQKQVKITLKANTTITGELKVSNTETATIIIDDKEISIPMDRIEKIEELQVENYQQQGKVFDVVEQMPSFPGGDAALMKYLSSHIKYPAVAKENGIQGRVIVSFIIERDGSVSYPKVTRSIDPSIDAEAIRLISNMPKFISGKQNGQVVRVNYQVPITFRLP